MTRSTLFTGALVLGLAIAGPHAATAAPSDEGFVREAASSGKIEVELGRYASRHAADPQVVKFGERMVTDHGRVNAELQRIAERESIVMPTDVAVAEDPLVKKLTALKGADFDRAYMKAMVEDHEEDVAKFREMSQSAATPAVKTFAQKTLPTLEEHLKMAKEIAARVEGHASAADVR
jgi:putative membrane protein